MHEVGKKWKMQFQTSVACSFIPFLFIVKMLHIIVHVMLILKLLLLFYCVIKMVCTMFSLVKSTPT